MSYMTRQFRSGFVAKLEASEGPVEAESPAFRTRFKGTATWLDKHATPRAVLRVRKARFLWDKIQRGSLNGPGAEAVKRDYAKEFAVFNDKMSHCEPGAPARKH